MYICVLNACFVAWFLQNESEHSILIAVPDGKDSADLLQQCHKLQTGFINYLQQKQAAGIVNVPNPLHVRHVIIVITRMRAAVCYFVTCFFL